MIKKNTTKLEQIIIKIPFIKNKFFVSVIDKTPLKNVIPVIRLDD